MCSFNRYAYVTHWNERALVKVDMEQFKYMKTINLVECQPMNAVFTEFGLIILQCQTPVTHQLNGELVTGGNGRGIKITFDFVQVNFW